MNIIELAKEAGLHRTEWNDWLCYDKTLERFAALVRAEALEEAAKVCETDEMRYECSDECAAAIRGLKDASR